MKWTHLLIGAAIGYAAEYAIVNTAVGGTIQSKLTSVGGQNLTPYVPYIMAGAGFAIPFFLGRKELGYGIAAGVLINYFVNGGTASAPGGAASS